MSKQAWFRDFSKWEGARLFGTWTLSEKEQETLSEESEFLT